MEEKVYFDSTDGLKLCGVFTYPNIKTNKCVILCHGITVDKDEDGIFTGLARKLANAGFAVFRFDFRGHGESEGNSVDMTVKGETEDIEFAVKYLESKTFSKFGLVAASFSGGAASFFTPKHQDVVKALILWNSLIDYNSHINTTTPWSKKNWGEPAFNRAEKYGFTEIGSRKFKAGRNLMHEIKSLKPWKQLLSITVPILFVHGDKDTYVPYEDSVKYSKLVKNGSLIVIKGAEHGFHDRKEDAEAADKATVEFIHKFL